MKPFIAGATAGAAWFTAMLWTPWAAPAGMLILWLIAVRVTRWAR